MARHYTVGIAGHVDHGKTTLVAALSGLDTDRMKVEKQRGLSIEFGIAPLAFPSGRQVSLVDVPGHRDFMKNTIRGLSAVDAAILVVAADDGVMPQTREHLEILRFFGVTTGFAVLTKADLVDPETLEMACLEAQDLAKGSFLESGPVIPFSGVDGRGRQEILAALDAMVSAGLQGKVSSGTFRMFIDQVRIFQGLGTVVSGTILSGAVRTGDRIEILPGLKTACVRSLESHHCAVESACAGSRVGINLQGIGSGELARGMVLAAPGSFEAAEYLNADLELCRLAEHSLRNGQRVKVHIGSAVTTALAVIMGCREELSPGDRDLVQFRLTEPLGAAPPDRFVITPMNVPTVLGGGRILETTKIKYRQARAEKIISYLTEVRTGDPERIVKVAVAAQPAAMLTAEGLSRSTGLDRAVFERALRKQMAERSLVPLDAVTFLAAKTVQEAKRGIAAAVEKTLAEDTLRDQLSKPHIAASIPWSLDPCALDFLLGELVREGVLASVNGGYALSEKHRRLGAVRDPLVARVLEAVENSGTVSVSVALVCEALGCPEEKPKVKRFLGHLVTKKHVVMLGSERFISRRGLELAKKRIRDWIAEHGRLIPADCNPVLGCGRNLGLPVLEHLDSVGFTVRRGNERVLKE
jgi:selenocysteine-specific elongation factor